MSSPLRFLPAALALLLSLAATLAAYAHDEAEADPALLLQAFNESCRRGFPDLDAIAAHVVTQGWTETTPRLVSGSGLIVIPRMFHKNGQLLSLVTPNGDAYSTVCQVTGAGTTRLTGKDVAAIASPSLNAGEPMLGPGNPKEDDLAVWTVKPGITVQAGVNVYRREVRSLTISVRQAR
ncbi:hypothetical protein [Sphingobium cupriresistens]|uniref:Uncharacterized protein n=1 Tax=Sphingobium cupriresistens LL01 TaxID=1420583 RepID=A0A0J7Y4W5_9SPHN|nr:hypothetical protein [Sphingobium cupriresistens]KMS58702.1 hypothetical protein V473_02730 [Sphingobium cupriresistens LL01]